MSRQDHHSQSKTKRSVPHEFLPTWFVSSNCIDSPSRSRPVKVKDMQTCKTLRQALPKRKTGKRKTGKNKTNFGPIRGGGKYKIWGAWRRAILTDLFFVYDFHVSNDFWGITNKLWEIYSKYYESASSKWGQKNLLPSLCDHFDRCFYHRGRSTTLVLKFIGHFWTVRTLSSCICLGLYSKKIPCGAFDPPTRSKFDI